MMRIARIGLVLVAAFLALAASAVGAEDSGLEIQQQGSVRFVSGGIGGDESKALQEMRQQFNLRLLFAAQGSGDYLADVDVRVQGAKGETVLEARSRGPHLLAQLPPGSYTVTATLEGKPISRRVTIPARAAVDQSFYWPVRG